MLGETRTRAFPALEWVTTLLDVAGASYLAGARAGFVWEECHADLPVPLRDVR